MAGLAPLGNLTEHLNSPFLGGGGGAPWGHQINCMTCKKQGRGLASVLSFIAGMRLSTMIIFTGLNFPILPRDDQTRSSFLKVWSAKPREGPGTLFHTNNKMSFAFSTSSTSERAAWMGQRG